MKVLSVRQVWHQVEPVHGVSLRVLAPVDLVPLVLCFFNPAKTDVLIEGHFLSARFFFSLWEFTRIFAFGRRFFLVEIGRFDLKGIFFLM